VSGKAAGGGFSVVPACKTEPGSAGNRSLLVGATRWHCPQQFVMANMCKEASRDRKKHVLLTKA